MVHKKMSIWMQDAERRLADAEMKVEELKAELKAYQPSVVCPNFSTNHLM